MRFSTGFSVLACGAVALAATISPDVFATRATSDVVANVNTLDTTLDATFAKLDVCQDSNCTVSLCEDADGALGVSANNLVGVQGNVTAELGQGCADIVVKIATKLNSHETSCNGQCGDLAVYAEVDGSLGSWLEQAEDSVPGILAELKKLVLADTIALLKAIGFTSVLALVS